MGFGRRRGASAGAATEHPSAPARRHARRERAGNSGGRPVRFGGTAARFFRVSKHWRRRSAPRRSLGAIFVPTPAGVVSHGAIPGEPGLSYSFDEPAGLLRLYRDDETGQQTVAEARLRPDGILAETETGLPIARMVGGASSSTRIRSLGAAGRSRGAKRARRTEALSRSRPRRAAWRVGARHAYQEQISRLEQSATALAGGHGRQSGESADGKERRLRRLPRKRRDDDRSQGAGLCGD